LRYSRFSGDDEASIDRARSRAVHDPGRSAREEAVAKALAAAEAATLESMCIEWQLSM